jgi:hypothetical protein
MKRIGLIATLFFIAFVFTQCQDDECPECDCTGGEFIYEAIGFSSISTEFVGDSLEPNILLEPAFLFAQHRIKGFQLIPSAYACQPSPVITPLNNLVDSIKVVSTPNYSNVKLEALLTYEPSYRETASIEQYNNSINRDLNYSGGDIYFGIKEKPTQSDSFIFSFRYYKDGAIIDSSFTQKFYISNE